MPSSPNPSLYSPHAKSSFMKGSLGQTNSRKQLLTGQSTMDSSRGLFQWVQSISLIGVAIDHTLHLLFPADMLSQGKSFSFFSMIKRKFFISFLLVA